MKEFFQKVKNVLIFSMLILYVGCSSETIPVESDTHAVLSSEISSKLEAFINDNDAIIYIYRLPAFAGGVVKWPVQADYREEVNMGQKMYLVKHMNSTNRTHIITHSGESTYFTDLQPKRYYFMRLKGFSLRKGLMDEKAYNEISKCKNITPASWNVLSVADPRSRIVTVARLDYDWRTGEGSGISEEPLYIDNRGFCVGAGKSGWVNVDTWGYFKDSDGVETKVLLKNVCFWVSNGGRSWLEFSVDKILLDGDENQALNFSTSIEKVDESVNQPVLIIEGNKKLIPVVSSLRDIVFKDDNH